MRALLLILAALAAILVPATVAQARNAAPAQVVTFLAADEAALPAAAPMAAVAEAEPIEIALASDEAFEVAALPTGRLRLSRPASGVPPPVAPPETEQTWYFGPSTLAGYGGVQPTGFTAPATAADTTNYTWNATYQWAVPKGTYGATRATLSGCEVMTVTDAAAVAFTLNLCADETIAGDFTWRWRDGDSTGSTTGTNQLLKSVAASAYADHIVMRRGTTLNTTADCLSGCSAGSSTLFNGTQQFRFACAMGNCNGANFNGSNHRVIRPEQGQTNTIGPITFEGSGLSGTILQGFTIDGEAESFNDSYMLASVLSGGVGPQGIVWKDLTVVGSFTDAYGKDRPNGISICMDCSATVENVTMSYVKNGVATLQSLGTPADVYAGSVAPNTGAILIKGNHFSNIGRDSVTTQCPRYITIEDNEFTDQKTEVTVGAAGTTPAWVNPFDSTYQAHADKVQLKMQQGPTNVCAYNYYPGLIIRNNVFTRGDGRDTLPFWDEANGFPNPNNSGGGTPSSAYDPDPTTAAADSQGVITTSFNWDCPSAGVGCSETSRKLVGGSTPRDYRATFDAPIVTGNIIQSAYIAGLHLGAIKDGTITQNSVLTSRLPGGRGNLESWTNAGLGNSGFIIEVVEGSPTIARNLGNASSSINGNASPPAAQVVEVTTAEYGTVFNNAAGKYTPRTAAEYRLYYRAVEGEELDLGGGVVAGAACFDGSVPGVGGVCP